MSKDTKIGIVTAAGYDEAERYYGRLHGLLDAIKASELLSPDQKQNIVIMGEPQSIISYLSLLSATSALHTGLPYSEYMQVVNRISSSPTIPHLHGYSATYLDATGFSQRYVPH